MYNCCTIWKGKAKPIVDADGNIRVLEVSQFADPKSINGKTWGDITLSYDVREKWVKAGYGPVVPGLMWYTIDATSQVFDFWIGYVDSSG